MRSFSVTKFTLVETSRFSDMYLRPYESTYDYQIQNQLDHYTEGGKKLTPNALSGVASTILKPSAIPDTRADLVNGFNENRFSFMLEITEHNPRLKTGGVRYVITGYTDHLGVINDSHGNPILAPDMGFYINNVHTIRDTLVNTGIGQTYRSNMVNSLQLPHTSEVATGGNGFNNKVTYLMRPEDVAGRINTESDPTHKYLNEYNNIIDLGGALSGVTSSNRSNTSRSHYLSDLFTGYMNATQEVGDFEVDSIWDVTKQNVRGTSLSNNPFVAELLMTTDFAVAGNFTYSELNAITGGSADHQADVITKSVVGGSMAGGLGQYTEGDGDDWGSATTTAQAATILQQSVGSIMSDCMLTSVAFVVHNNTLTGEMDFRFMSPINSFTEGIDLSPLLENVFKPRVMAEIVDDISFNNQVAFSLECVMDMHYESTIMVNIDGEDGFYVAPSFCDGITTPVLTHQNQMLSTLANDVVDMVGNINPQTQEFLQQHMQTQQQQIPANLQTGFSATDGGVYIPDSI